MKRTVGELTLLLGLGGCTSVGSRSAHDMRFTAAKLALDDASVVRGTSPSSAVEPPPSSRYGDAKPAVTSGSLPSLSGVPLPDLNAAGRGSAPGAPYRPG